MGFKGIIKEKHHLPHSGTSKPCSSLSSDRMQRGDTFWKSVWVCGYCFIWRRNAEDGSAASGTRKLLTIICLGHSWVVQQYRDAHVQMCPKLWEIKPTFGNKQGLEGSGLRIATVCWGMVTWSAYISDTTRILSIFGRKMEGWGKKGIIRRFFITYQSGSTHISSKQMQYISTLSQLFYFLLLSFLLFFF